MTREGPLRGGPFLFPGMRTLGGPDSQGPRASMAAKPIVGYARDRTLFYLPDSQTIYKI